MPIAPTPLASESTHWYSTDGKPVYTVPKAKGGGERNTTLLDARKMNLLPSVTTVLSVCEKPAVTAWKVRNAIEATLTTPMLPGEDLDTFAARILEQDSQSVSDMAKARGTAIHALLEAYYSGNPTNGYEVFNGEDLWPYVNPVIEACAKFGKVLATEKVVVGKGYAGKLDIAFVDGVNLTVVDFKTAKTIPKTQYPEHRMQLGAYAVTFEGYVDIKTANIYINSAVPGDIKVVEDEEWLDAYEHGFRPALAYWQWLKGYKPQQ